MKTCAKTIILQGKDMVKSFRKHLDTKKTGHFMHDQYPPEVIVQRKKLIPIMLKARQDGNESYIKYNKMYVEGSVGVWNCNGLTRDR